MSWKNRYVVCTARGEKAFGDRYIFESSAQHNAHIMNRIARKAAYHVHPESELDADGRCPHYRPFDLHQAALPALLAAAAHNRPLAVLLAEVNRGTERGRARRRDQ